MAEKEEVVPPGVRAMEGIAKGLIGIAVAFGILGITAIEKLPDVAESAKLAPFFARTIQSSAFGVFGASMLAMIAWAYAQDMRVKRAEVRGLRKWLDNVGPALIFIIPFLAMVVPMASLLGLANELAAAFQ